MWISRAHWALIEERARESNLMAEARIADKQKVIDSLEDRLKVVEYERLNLTERLVMRENERMKPPEAVAPTVGEPESWETIMQREIDRIMEPKDAKPGDSN